MIRQRKIEAVLDALTDLDADEREQVAGEIVHALVEGDSLQAYVASLERDVARLERERDQARRSLAALAEALDGIGWDRAMREHHVARRQLRRWSEENGPVGLGG